MKDIKFKNKFLIISLLIGMVSPITFLSAESITSLFIDTNSLPSGTTGTKYFAGLSGSGGSGSYSWSLTSGSLPPGLDLIPGVCVAIPGPCRAPAEISGTPTATGNYVFTILVSDGISNALKEFRISVTSQQPSAKFFRFVMRDNSAESFIVKITDPTVIKQVLDELYGQRHLIVGGVLNSGDGGFNSPWSWHLEPSSIKFGENYIEVCDARPSYIESHLAEWLGQRYCPWIAVIDSVYDAPPSTVSVPTVSVPTDSLTTQVRVSASILNVRQEGSLAAAKIGTVKKEDLLKKLEEKNGWAKVQLPNNQVGWISSQYVVPASASPTKPLNNRVIVVAPVLNVRSGPGVNNQPISIVIKNEVLEKIEVRDNWVKVLLSNGRVGWVSSKFIK